MPKWDVPFWVNGVFGFAGLSDLVNTGHPILERYSFYKQFILYGIGYFVFSAFSCGPYEPSHIDDNSLLILVNMNHAILIRGIPVIITFIRMEWSIMI